MYSDISYIIYRNTYTNIQIYLQGGDRHQMESDEELNGPCPATFTAATLNSYSWFSIRFGILNKKFYNFTS